MSSSGQSVSSETVSWILQHNGPYIHTTLLINELVKLQHEEYGGKIRLKESSGMRKDRYSSLSYNYYVATQLEAKLSKITNDDTDIGETFIFRAPKSAVKKGGRH